MISPNVEIGFGFNVDALLELADGNGFVLA